MTLTINKSDLKPGTELKPGYTLLKTDARRKKAPFQIRCDKNGKTAYYSRYELKNDLGIDICESSPDAVELEPDGNLPPLEPDGSYANSLNGTNIVSQSSDSDTPESQFTEISAPSGGGPDSTMSADSLPHASHSRSPENGSEAKTVETASLLSSESSEKSGQNSWQLRTYQDSSPAPSVQETGSNTSNFFSENSSTSGTMQNGRLSAAPTLERPGAESGSLLLQSPTALSRMGGKGGPPGTNRLEQDLQERGAIASNEVSNPEFLESGSGIPVGWTDPADKRSASEFLAEMESLENAAPQSATPSTPELPVLESPEFSISTILSTEEQILILQEIKANNKASKQAIALNLGWEQLAADVAFKQLLKLKFIQTDGAVGFSLTEAGEHLLEDLVETLHNGPTSKSEQESVSAVVSLPSGAVNPDIVRENNRRWGLPQKDDGTVDLSSLKTAPDEDLPRFVNIDEIIRHPLNEQIYGEEDLTELEATIDQSGWVKPIVVSITTRHIVDGNSCHRCVERLTAKGDSRFKSLEVKWVRFATPEQELKRLLEANKGREKNDEQKLREAKAWRSIIEAEAKANMSAGGQGLANLPTLHTRQRLADIAGVGERTFAKGEKIIELLDKLEAQEGESPKAAEWEESARAKAAGLRHALNEQSVNAAFKVAAQILSEKQSCFTCQHCHRFEGGEAGERQCGVHSFTFLDSDRAAESYCKYWKPPIEATSEPINPDLERYSKAIAETALLAKLSESAQATVTEAAGVYKVESLITIAEMVKKAESLATQLAKVVTGISSLADDIYTESSPVNVNLRVALAQLEEISDRRKIRVGDALVEVKTLKSEA